MKTETIQETQTAYRLETHEVWPHEKQRQVVSYIILPGSNEWQSFMRGMLEADRPARNLRLTGRVRIDETLDLIWLSPVLHSKDEPDSLDVEALFDALPRWNRTRWAWMLAKCDSDAKGLLDCRTGREPERHDPEALSVIRRALA